MKYFFPYDEIRPVQEDMMKTVSEAVENKKGAIIHAPTGIGKTAAALSAVLPYSVKHKKTVLFLTSRHTQHKIAVETLKEIEEKHKLGLIVTDIIGKKHMCIQDGVEALYTSEFFEYCKKLKEEGNCKFYNNLYNKAKIKPEAESLIGSLHGIHSTAEVKAKCQNADICPYEVSQILAKKANVIVADYYYLFHPFIRKTFLNKIGKELGDLIVIIDEGHNIPGRIRELMTVQLSLKQIERAEKEAQKHGIEIMEKLDAMKEMLYDFEVMGSETVISTDDVVDRINGFTDYEELLDDIREAAELVIEKKNRTSLAPIALFLEHWREEAEGFLRYIKKDNDIIVKKRCMDPSLFTAEIVNNVHSAIMMSGTLVPTAMYKDLIGFDDVLEEEYDSPFPKENRLNLVVPKTSTKYSARSMEQFKRIADICAKAVDKIPGNVIIFFPSYALQDSIGYHIKTMCKKSVFSESPRFSAQDKHDMMERFKEYKKSGALLLAVASGSFGEGIDLPGDLLSGVIVVGIPLNVPDLETKALIAYYEKKFGKGREYAYTYPAFNKILQNAGRCIRSKTDKGVILFVDERFAWPTYKNCFPRDLHIQLSQDHEKEVEEFFSQDAI